MDDRFCPYCGKEISENAKVCPYCGEKQKSASPKEAPAAPETAAAVAKPKPVKQVKAKKKKKKAKAKPRGEVAGANFIESIKGWPRWAWAVVAVAVIAAMYFLLINGGDSASQNNQAASSGDTGQSSSQTDYTRHPFDLAVGRWTSIDIDGSYQEMTIRDFGNGNYSLVYTDNAATSCGVDSNGVPLYAARLSGEGKASGNNWVVNAAVSCLSDPVSHLGDFEFTYAYNSTSDTLRDNYGVVWSRK